MASCTADAPATTTGPSEPTTLPVPGDTPRHSARRRAAGPPPEGPSSDISASPRAGGAAGHSPRHSPRHVDVDLRDALRRCEDPLPPPPRRDGSGPGPGWRDVPPPIAHDGLSPRAETRGRVYGWHLVSQKLIDSLAANAAELDALDRDRRRAPTPARADPPRFHRPSPRSFPIENLSDYLDLLSTPGGTS